MQQKLRVWVQLVDTHEKTKSKVLLCSQQATPFFSGPDNLPLKKTHNFTMHNRSQQSTLDIHNCGCNSLALGKVQEQFFQDHRAHHH